MKPQLFVKLVFALAFTATVIGFSSFRQKPNDASDSFRKKQSANDKDTTRKRNRNWTYWNDDQLSQEMKQLDLQMEELEQQMEHFDSSQYQRRIAEAFDEINFQKVNEQVNEALKNMDLQKMKISLDRDATNFEKMKMNEVQKELQKAKMQLKNQKFSFPVNAGRINTEVKKALENAKRSVEKSKEEITNVRKFTDTLEKDNLIDKSKAYEVEVKDNELFIDGKKQPKEVSNRYKSFYGSGNFTISMSANDDFWI